MAEIYPDAEPRPATIAFIKQFARVYVPNITDKIINRPRMHRACIGAMASLALLFTACSDNNEPEGPVTVIDPIEGTGCYSMFVFNEGAWGQNNARIDYLDFGSGLYEEDLYTDANESVVMGLGDVGNDLALYDGRLYAVLNGSHKVEVMHAGSTKRIGQVDVSSPRAIALSGDKGYVTSWVDNGSDNGSVVEFDLNTLKVTRTISVGREPEGLAVAGDKLYVACSGGMHAPDYEDEMWVYNLSDLTLDSKITVAPNLHRVVAGNDGSVWVNSRGDYADVPSGLYRIKDGVVTSANVPCAGFALGDDKVYYYASEWNNDTYSYTMAYGSLDRSTLAPGPSFITDGTQADIVAPYAIAVAGSTVFVSDAKNYTTSGALYVYTPEGKRQRTYTTGICPGTLLVVK